MFFKNKNKQEKEPEIKFPYRFEFKIETSRDTYTLSGKIDNNDLFTLSQFKDVWSWFYERDTDFHLIECKTKVGIEYITFKRTEVLFIRGKTFKNE